MLINKFKKSYRDLITYINPVQPVVVEPGSREAANASAMRQSDMQERRQRRERRMGRANSLGNIGWNVRTW